MNDQHITAPAPPHPAAGAHYKLTSTALWIGLGAGMLLNFAFQAAGLWLLAAPFGLIAFASAVALIARAVVSRKDR
ncbi:hypothetical protein [Glycomyces albidus]|uniref:Uncharacterized protein n=1 Tax=Glycomyces albidus TaxID=2656774 RepID=A0A6L5G935_9ACTN|nr:hypothetical protein [Glycomyces albidus]MQM26199.1 hypothetical protein [Glycomyces albidus]